MGVLLFVFYHRGLVIVQNVQCIDATLQHECGQHCPRIHTLLEMYADRAEKEETLPQVALTQVRAVNDTQQDAARLLDSLWITNITVQGDGDRPLSGALIQGRVYAEGVIC